MIQTFIRAGSRQLTVLTCAAVALATAGLASAAAPAPDVRSEAIAMGIDPDVTSTFEPATTMRRAGAKSTGTMIWDNGIQNGVNGWASELNTVVSDARVADDFILSAPLTTVNHVTARLYNSSAINGRLEIYANDISGGPCTPRRPFSTTPPLFIFNTTTGPIVAFGFGFPIVEFEWLTPTLILTPNKYWCMAAVNGNGGGRGFFATSFNAFGGGASCRGAARSTFFGIPEWTTPAYGSSNEFAFRLWNPGVPPPPPPGSCDLSAIEAKLDDETLFTDDGELGDLQIIIESRSSQASVDALEAKADAMQLSLDVLQNTLCDIIRLLHTPNGLREATCNGVDYEWNGLQGGGGD